MLTTFHLLTRRAGMIVPYVVAYSLMWGAVISWGVMWPLLAKKEGDWYPAGIQDGDFRGLFGYKVISCDACNSFVT